MATTTAAAIRDVMRSTVKALTPATLAEVKFRPFQQRSMSGFDFRQWCEKSPTAAFRLVSILDEGTITPPVVSNMDREWVEKEFLVQVSYPRDHRYGSQAGLDLHDVIESDLRQIEHAIGTNGYATLDLSTGGDACVVTTGTQREEGEACLYGQIRLSVQFWRAMP